MHVQILFITLNRQRRQKAVGNGMCINKYVLQYKIGNIISSTTTSPFPAVQLLFCGYIMFASVPLNVFLR